MNAASMVSSHCRMSEAACCSVRIQKVVGQRRKRKRFVPIGLCDTAVDRLTATLLDGSNGSSGRTG